jgi:DNA-3-methyladenine glycosylase II
MGKIPASAIKQLSQNDLVMSELIKRRGIIEIPVVDDHFYSLVMSIVHQQLSMKAANTIFRRLQEHVNYEMLPEILWKFDEETYRSFGVSRQKAAYILDISRHFIEQPEKFHNLDKQDDQEVIANLCSIKGVGKWTAQMFLMFTLVRPDVFPVDDLGIRMAITKLYQVPKDAPKKEFELLAERWAPYRSYACHYLWKHQDS